MNLVDLRSIDLRDDIPQTVLSHPGMISAQERNLLYTLAANHYSGSGCIIDAGIFLGASTMAFAHGLRKHGFGAESSQSAPAIESFEKGVVGANFERFARKADLPMLSIGENYEELLRHLMEPIHKEINLHVGDILDFDRSLLGNIEICFLDILKSKQITAYCMKTFLPRLLPGAYLIQQDYFFDELPFIKYSMEAVASHFEYLGEVRSSSLFRLTRTLDEGDLPTDYEDPPDEEKLQLHRKAERRTKDPYRQYLMQLSRTRLLVELGELAGAHSTWQEADEEYSSFIRSEDGTYKPEIAWRITKLRRLLDRKRSHRTIRGEQAATRKFQVQALSDRLQHFRRHAAKLEARIQELSETRPSLRSLRTRHGYEELSRKTRVLKRNVDSHGLPAGGFVELRCGGHNPVALAALHYLNGFSPCHAIDSGRPTNETLSALLMYEILANILCFPDRYCLGDTKVADLLDRMRTLDLQAFEAGDFSGGLKGVADHICYEPVDIRHSKIEDDSISRLVSFAVLDDVDDLDSMCEKIHRILRTGGICFHFIDFTDHRIYRGDGKLDALTYLTKKDVPKGVNRLLAHEIVEAHERHGFEILTDRRRSVVMSEEARKRLLPRFQRMREEDVSVVRQHLVVRRC